MSLSADTNDDLAYFRHFFEAGGLEVDETDVNGLRTQLHNAADNNCLCIAEFLLRRNANAGLVAEDDHTPLHIAASKGHDAMVALILKHSSRERVRKFIDAKAKDGSTALHLAARNNRYEAVRSLLSYGANFEIKDKRDETPIEVTTLEDVRRLLGSTGEMSRAAVEAKHNSLKAFKLRLLMLPQLEYIATSLARNRQGYTPLQVAIDSMHLPTVKVILDTRLQRLETEFALPGSTELLGKQVNYLRTLAIELHLGKLKYEGLSEKEALREGSHALLNAWIVARAFDKYRSTLENPIEEARFNVIDEALEVVGFDPRHFEASYKVDEDPEKFVSWAQGTKYYNLLSSGNPADRVSFVDLFENVIIVPLVLLQKSINSTNLLAAAKEGDLTLARKCVELELLVDVNVRDADERRPLHVAAAKGNLTMLEILLKKRADMLIATEEKGETPLHVAVSEGYLNIVEALLHNCDVDKVNDYVNAKMKSSGATALHLAAKNGRLDIVWCLMEHHAIYCLLDKGGKQPRDLSTSAAMTKLFELIDEVFDLARNGDVKIVERFENCERDLLLAVGNVCDKEGHSVPQVATLNKHREIEAKIFEMVVEAKKSKNVESLPQ